MKEKENKPFSLRMGHVLEAFVLEAVRRSGRSKNAVIKSCIQLAKEDKAGLFKKIGVENAETAK